MLKRFLNSFKGREIAIYLIFGVLTTVVNYAVYFPLYYQLGSASISTALAWSVAVLFAYFTNKPFVFKSYDWTPQVVLPEMLKFIGSRVFSGLLDIGIVKLTIDIMGLNPIFWKIVSGAIVIVINYLFSKLLTFRKKA